MCFVENTHTKAKQLVGYTILDLRSAQEQKEPKFSWRPLLNSKYRGPANQRPELQLALQLLKSDDGQAALLAEENLESLGNLSLNGQYPSLSYSVNQIFENDLRVRIANGWHKIWEATKNEESDCNLCYSLNVVIASVSHLHNLVKPASAAGDAEYHFRFALFGSAVRTRSFSRLDVGPLCNEQVTYKIATPNLNTLETYFRLYPTLDIQLCNSQKAVLGALTLQSLRDLVRNNKVASPVIGEYKVRCCLLLQSALITLLGAVYDR